MLIGEALDLVRSVVPPTPLLRADLGGEVLLKREDLGPNGSFKWRGALAALAELKRGGASAVITASTGNHGVAAAWAAERLDMTAHVVVPENAIAVKCDMIQKNGAFLYRRGANVEEAAAHARQLGHERGIPLFEDGTSEAQLAGTATIGYELAAQATLDTVVVPVACGALAGGIGWALKSGSKPPRLIGVQSASFSRMTAMLRGEAYLSTGQATIADGLADDRIVEPAYSHCRRYLDDVLTVSDRQLEDAMRELWRSAGVRAEPAAAAPLAGLRIIGQSPGSAIALVISGRNIAPDVAARVFGTASSSDQPRMAWHERAEDTDAGSGDAATG
jgi:threonine dehydratase